MADSPRTSACARTALVLVALLTCAAGRAAADADLTLAKSHSGDFTSGKSSTYRLVVTNVGTTATLSTTTVLDTLPAGLTFLSGLGPGWSVSASGQIVTCTLTNPIAAADTSGITLNVMPDANAVPSVINSAVVSSPDDANNANDRATDPTNVVELDLAVSKSHTGNFIAGTNGVYTIQVANVGDAPTFAVTTVRDTLPSGLTFVSGVGTGWSVSNSGQIVIATHSGVIATGASRSFTLTVSVAASAIPSVNNFASVATTGDAVSANDRFKDATVVTATPDLSITKTHSGDFAAGSNGAWTITINNVGSGATSGTTTVLDTLPAGVSFVSGVGTGWSVSASGQIVTATRSGAIAASGSSAFTLTAAISAAAFPSFVNRAHVSVSGDANGANDHASDAVNVTGAPNAVITKSAVGGFAVGSNGTYKIDVQNTGTVSTSGTTTVVDTLPAGLSFVSGSGSGWSVSNSGPIVTATRAAAIAPGNTSSVSFTVAITLPAAPSVTNSASVSTAGDVNPADDRSTVVTPVTTVIDLGVTKSHSGSFVVGSNASWTIGVTNIGTGPTSGVTVVRDTLPAGMTFVSGSGTGWSFSTNGSIVNAFQVNPIAPGGNSSFTLTVAVGAAALPSVTNAATVEAIGDNASGNDRATDPTTVTPQPAPNLGLTKSHTGSFTAGANGTWTIAVSNAGAAATSGLTTVRDTLPAGMTFVSGSGSGWSFSSSGQVVTAIFPGAIAAGGNTSLAITAAAGAPAVPGVTNSATVSTPGDTDASNDRDSDVTVVNAAATPNLRVTKSHAGSFTAGTNGTWNLAIANLGTAATSGLTTVLDTLPAGVTFVSGSGAGWSFSASGQVVTALRPSAIAAGGNAPFSLTAAIGAGAVPSVTNAASVSTPGDSDPSNDRDTDPTIVNAAPVPDLGLTKSHTGSFTAGTSGTWTIALDNSGAAATSGITTVLDTLPAGVTFVSGSGTGWSFSANGPIVTAIFPGTIAAGGNTSFTLTAAVGAGAVPGVTNSASVSTPGDNDPANDRASDPTVVNAAAVPNLSIAKSHAGNFTVGTNGTWTITVTNSGAAATSGITTVLDTLPAGVTYVSGSGSGWSFSSSGQVVTAIRPTAIGAGASAPFTLTAVIGAGAGPSVTNSASVSTPGDNDPSNDRASDATTVNGPNLGLSKSHTGSFVAGTNGTWTITVSNSGAVATTGITTVRDTLPAGTSYVSASGTGWNIGVSGQVVTAVFPGTIAASGNASFTLTAAIGAGAIPSVTNSASVTTNGDTEPGNDRASDPTAVSAAPVPNLGVAKTHTGNFVAGTNGTWTITVTNSGSAATTGVTTVLDTLPAGITYVSGSGAGWSFSANGQIVSAVRVASIAAGANSPFTLTAAVAVAAAPSVTNFASVSTPGDLDPSNDRASDVTTVNAPDLAIAKSHSGSFAAGTNGTWNITVSNPGTAATTGVTTVRDTLPAGVTYVSASGTGWSFSVNGQVVTATNAGAIAAGGSAPFSITAALGAAAVPGVTNSATVSTPGDSDPANDRASDATVVNAAAVPNLGITKTHTGNFVAGTNGTWTMMVANSGSAATTSVTTVLDTLPAGITYVSGSGAGWSFSANGQIVSAVRVASIAAGANSSFTLTTAVAVAAAPGVTNSASVSTPGDLDPSNDRASDATVVNAPNLAIAKSHTGNFAAGTNGTWNITVSNPGTAATTGITTVRDTLPAGVTYVSATGAGWSFSVNGQVVTASNAGTIAAGGSAPFSITVALGAAAVPGVTNSATVSTPGDSDPANDRTSDATVVNAAAVPNLGITKTHTGNFVAGTNGTWTITVSNSGSAATTGVTTVLDTLPAGTTYVSGSGSGWSFSANGQVVSAVHPASIATSTSAPFTLTAAVAVAAVPGVTNSASVDTPGDLDPSNDRGSDATVVNAPNLAIAKTHSGSFAAGTNGTWNINVSNPGTAATTGITTVRDTLPAGVTYVSATGTGWSFSVNGQVVTASNAGTIAAGGSAPFSITAALGAAAVPGVTNLAAVSTPGDSDPANDRASDATVVNAAAVPDLGITKTHTGNFVAGTNGTWTMTVANSGSAATTGVTTVLDTLPAGITYVSGSGAGWSFSANGQIVSAVRVASIAAGANSSFTLTSAIGASAVPGVTNFASVSTPGDLDPANDRASDAAVVNAAAVPDLALTKSHTGNFTAGANGTWNLNVTNFGSAPTSGITTVLDTLPAGITYVSGSGSGWSFSASGQVVTALHPSALAVSSSAPFSLTVAVGAAAVPGVTNSASVSTPGDGDPSDDRASDPTTVTVPNLSVSKTHTGSFTVGTNGTWTITATNSGTAPTSGVTTVLDTLPAGITYVSGTGPGWTFSVSGQVVTATHAAAIASGANRPFDLSVAVGAAAVPGVTNSASVSTPGDIDPSGDRASDPTVVNPALVPDLGITKAHTGSFAAGTNGVWTITVANSGSAATSGITTVLDTLPAGVTYVSATGTGWSFSTNGQVVTALHPAAIAIGTNRTFDLTVAVGAGAVPGVTNSASVSTPGDSNPANDRASDPTVVSPAAVPNLSIGKSHVGSFAAGTNAVWTINITNSGSAPTTATTTVLDTLPAGITFVSGAGSGWSFSAVGPIVTAIRLSPIGIGSSSSFDLTVAVGAAAIPGVTNSASVSTLGDPDLSNNRASDPTLVNPAAVPDLAITKSHAGNFTAGANGTWTIAISNTGSAPTTGTTTVLDTLPAGVTYVSGSGAGWGFSANGQVVTAIRPSVIGVGGSTSFDLNVAVTAAAVPSVTNSASVSTPGDTDPANDRATDPTTVTAPNLSISKSHSGNFVAGTNAAWTINVTNSGTAPTSGVTTVLDTLPAGTTYVSGAGTGWSFAVSGTVVTALHMGTIATSTSRPFVLTVAVDAAAVPGVTNSATVSTAGDSNPSGDRASDPTIVDPALVPDLSISKVHVGSFTVGTNGSWKINVTNTGTAATFAATTVLDTLPAGVTYVSATGTGWSFSVNGQIVTALHVGAIAPATSRSFDVTVAVGAAAQPGVTNSASVSTPGDTNPSGDRASDPTVVNAALTPNLSIAKTHVGDFTAGTNGTWTITVTNTGSAPTSGVTTVTDTLPAGISYVSGSGSGWGFSTNGQVVTVIRPASIAAAGSSSFTIQVAVGALAMPGVTNSASVSTPGDTDPSGDRASDPTIVVAAAAPNLSIAKTHVGSFAVGTNGTWTIDVTNSGTAATLGTTTVLDTLPAGLSYVSATGAGWSFSVNGQVVTAIRIASIAPSASSSFTLTAAVGALAQPGVTNSATVSTAGDTDPSGDRASDPTVVSPAAVPNLSLSKTHVGTFTVGTNGTWTLTVANSGSAPTSGTTTVVDTLPVGMTFAAGAGAGWSFSVNGSIVTAIRPTSIAVGGNSAFTLSAAVGATALPGVTNSATVSTPGDIDATNDRASDVTVVVPAAAPNLSLTKSHAGDFTAGTLATWTLTATNSGTAPTFGTTTVVDTLPAGVSFDSATGTGWSFSVNGSIVTAIHIAPIAAGTSSAFDLTVTVGAAAVPGVTNSATVSTAGDTDPTGDRASDPTIVQPAAAPNLGLTKSHAGNFTVGTNGTWTITVANSGTAPTFGTTTVVDTLPAGIGYVVGSGSGWSFSVNGPIVTAIRLSPIAAGGSAAFDLTVAVTAPAVPGATNSATVSTPGDLDPTNDRGSDFAIVNAAATPNLVLAKSHAGNFTAGTNGTWTLVVTNVGLAATSGVTTVIDTLPAGISYVSGAGAGWSFSVSGQVVTAVRPGTIAPAATSSFDLTVAVGAAAQPGVTNFASVSTPGDNDPAGDRASDPTVVSPAAAPNLGISKTHVGSFTVGTNGTWTIAVTNSGSAPTSGVTTVTDTLPAGITYVSGAGSGWSFSVNGAIVTAVRPASIAASATSSFTLTAAVGVTALPGVTNSASVSTPGDTDPSGDRASDPTLVNPAPTPNLRLTKTHVGSFAVGTSGTWTLTVTNTGTAPTLGTTTVRDTLPAGISYAAGTGAGWSFSVSGQVVTAVFPAILAAGAGTSFDLGVTVAASAVPGVTNFASVSTPGDSDPTNDRASDPTVVNPAAAPNLSITKTHTGSFTVGTTGVWTLAVTNSGSAPTTGITTVLDTLPAGVSYVSALGVGWSFSVSGQVVTAIHPDPIAVGAGSTFDLTAAISLPAQPAVTNFASVSTAGDNDPSGNRASDRTTVNAAAAPNLSIGKSHTGSFTVGSNGTWTITVTNWGTAATTGVTTVRDTLPAGTTRVLTTGTGWSFSTSGQVVTAIHPAAIAPGISRSFDLVVAVSASAMPGVTNSASVSTLGDTDPTGDRATDPTLVNAAPAPDLALAKSHAGSFAVGANGTWTLTVSNIGPAATSGVTTVTDTLPAGATFSSGTGNGWSFSVSGQVVTAIHPAAILPGGAAAFDLTAMIDAAARPSVTNAATVDTPGDLNPANDRALDPTAVNPAPAPNLNLTKTHVSTFVVGANGNWTLVVTNTGSAATTGVTTVRDTLPAGISYLSGTGSGWGFSVNGQVVTAIHPGSIAPGSGASFDLGVAIGAAAAPGVTNSATVDTPGDTDASDDRAVDPTVVNLAPLHDVGIAMSDVGSVVAGDTTSYTLTITNTRSIATTGTIVVRDTLPSGLAFVSASGAGWSFNTSGSIVTAFWTTSLAAGATTSCDITVRVGLSAMPMVTNAATVSLPGDADATNDRASDDLAVLAPPAPNLRMSMTHAGDFIVGRNGTWTLTVSNVGGSDASGPIVVRDTLPAGVTYAAATGSGWNFSQNGNVVQAVNLGTVAPGNSSSFEITVSVGIVAAPGVVNSATVSVGGDANAIDDRFVDQVIVHVPGMLTLEKTVTPAVVEPGDFVTYTLTIRNPSPTDADSVELRDRLPIGVSYQPSSAFVDGTMIANPVARASDGLVFSLGTIANGGTVVLRYRARVGVGTPLGDGINRARAVSVTDNVESNLASAKIEVRDGDFDPRGIVFGKVYVDRDCDAKEQGTQGDRELGIPGVRLLLEDGSVAITDVEGKYHFEGVSPRAHVLRVDETTLPPGSRLAAPGSRDMLDNGTRLVDLQRGEMHRADFLEISHEEDVLDAVVARRALGNVKSALAERIVMDADTLRRVRPEPAPAVGATGLLAHGIVTGRLDLRTKRGALANRDAFEDELRDAALGTSDGRAHAAARGAMYMQGVLTGGYELSVATDSERDPRQGLFRDIEPEHFYPVYGDASLLEYGAPSTSVLFARIRKDSSFVQYGDFTTPAEPARRLGSYDRAFTGVMQRFAGRPGTLDAWGAESRTRRIVDELNGRGTSGPYALGRTDVRENSEQVDVVVRDRNQPSRVVSTRRLVRFADYQLDPMTGEIVLKAPLASLDRDLNPQSLRVTYEVEGAGDPYLVYGAGLRTRIGRLAELSGNAVHDEDPLDPRDLLSAGAELFAGRNTELRFEIARTDSASVRGGDAKRAELVHRSPGLNAEVTASRVAADFVNPSSPLVPGRSEFSARMSAALGKNSTFRAEGLSTQDDRTDGQRKGFDVSVERRFGRVALLAGFRDASETTTPADSSTAGTTPNEFQSARGRLTLPFIARGTLFGEYEQDTQNSAARRALLGGDWQAKNGTRLYARHELLSSYSGPYALDAQRDLQTTLVGLDAPVSATGRSFGEYRARDAFAGREAQAAFGLRDRWTARPGLHLDGSFERILPLADGGPTEATALTGAIEYTASPRWKGTARGEWRTSEQGDERLMSAGLSRKLSRDWTFLSRALWHDRANLERTELRARTGLAWRQTLTDRWNVLGRYDVHRLEEGSGPARIDRFAHVLGGDLNFRPGTRWTTSLHATGRHADDRSNGVRTQSRTTWLASRLLWDVTPRWDAGLSASSLFDRGVTAHRYGLGLEAGRTLGTNVRLAGGYNLFGYRDQEMTGDLTTDHGAYLTLRFKFDEALFRARRANAPAEGRP